MNILGYTAVIKPLAPRLGGGFVGYAPELKGCLSDGETRDEAAENLADAIQCWLDSARASGQVIPMPHRALA